LKGGQKAAFLFNEFEPGSGKVKQKDQENHNSHYFQPAWPH